ncbi:uncharacterized protein LOC136081996 isoform X1 [Hydra vulgaris]|uniref:Uncharacterized protein LOC136081996 isoform X1 n=1 Tax=Hydra vulgaris TaxID=6087 RepID=A0ABM4C4U3_HYDVU
MGVNWCLRILYPIRSVPNNMGIVLARVTSLILLSISLVLLAIAVALKGWKEERYYDEIMEISLWTICRYAFGTIRGLDFNKCFENYYAEQPFQAWFECFRFFLVLALAILVLVFIFVCYEQSFKDERLKKSWNLAAIACIFSAFLTGTSLALFWYEYSFDFLEETFRWEVMGWTEETTDYLGFTEYPGPPLVFSVMSFFLMFFTSYSCYVTHCCETNVFNNASLKKFKEQKFEEGV